jgi:hypothetical protein
MMHRRCRYCRQSFQPNRYHPQQQVCNQPACQSQRRSNYHRQKIASDPVYRQICLENPRKWRETHTGYWKKSRRDHPEQVDRKSPTQVTPECALAASLFSPLELDKAGFIFFPTK